MSCLQIKSMMFNAFHCNNIFLCHIGPLRLCGRGKYHPIHYERATKSRSGSSLSCPQQPCWSWRALCTQVQQPVCSRKLLRSCKSCCQCTKGRCLGNVSYLLRMMRGSFSNVGFIYAVVFAVFHELSLCHLCHLRVSCEPQTPFVVFRAFQLSRARPPHCCSTLASCWTRASLTNLSPLSYAGLFSNKGESSFLRSG